MLAKATLVARPFLEKSSSAPPAGAGAVDTPATRGFIQMLLFIEIGSIRSFLNPTIFQSCKSAKM